MARLKVILLLSKFWLHPTMKSNLPYPLSYWGEAEPRKFYLSYFITLPALFFPSIVWFKTQTRERKHSCSKIFQTQVDTHTHRPIHTHSHKCMQFSSECVISLPVLVLHFLKKQKSNECWKSIREEKKSGIFAYLIICVAIVCLLWFEIPQDHDPRLKSNYKLERKSDRQSVR